MWETIVLFQMLLEDMKSALVDQAHKYERKLHKATYLNIYKDILFARGAWREQ